MPITPLQRLLRDQVVPAAEIRQAAGISRYTLRRYRNGESYPTRETATALIRLFRERGLELDFNGCYSAEVGDE